MQINDITSSTLSTLLQHESSILTVLSNATSLLNYEDSSKSKDSITNKLTSKDLDGNYFYKLAQKNKKTAISAPYFDSLSKELIITITSPILSDANEFLGAINLDISMGTFSNYLNTALQKHKVKV